MKPLQRMDMGVTTVIRGELVLRQITALKTELKDALDHIDSLLINFSEIKAQNPCFLQGLCRGHRAMDELKKALLGTAGHAVQDAPSVSQEDFFRHVGCMLDCQDSCLWANG